MKSAGLLTEVLEEKTLEYKQGMTEWIISICTSNASNPVNHKIITTKDGNLKGQY